MTDIDVRTLKERIGQELAVSEWVEVSQERIDRFADATDDHQWIHIDPARAATESPFRATIAHGFLTLSLLSTLLRQAMQFSGLRMAINYGLNRVRFMSPVLSGSRIRARVTLQSAEDITGGVQATWLVTVERDSGDKPACIAEWVIRYYVPQAEPSPDP
jgi:acyl dehydratase